MQSKTFLSVRRVDIPHVCWLENLWARGVYECIEVEVPGRLEIEEEKMKPWCHQFHSSIESSSSTCIGSDADLIIRKSWETCRQEQSMASQV